MPMLLLLSAKSLQLMQGIIYGIFGSLKETEN